MRSLFGAVQRNGQVRARVPPDITVRDLRRVVNDFVCESADLMTDENNRRRATG